MAKNPVVIWFDVEDYITPEADGALLDLLEIFERHNALGIWKIVGEKIRVMESRGRTDIIEKLRAQEVGYHSENHSIPPTPAEYMNEVEFEKGAREFGRREKPGFDDMIRLFGDGSISCYGQPGGSWGPPSYVPLRQWGIPLYLDECYQVGLDENPFWYCGMLNVLRMKSNCARLNWRAENECVEGFQNTFDGIADRLTGEGGGTISVFYHPCEWSSTKFWDGVNFSRGSNPPREDWKPSPLHPPEVRANRTKWFEQSLEHMVSHEDCDVIGGFELCRRYADRAGERTYIPKDVAEITGDLSGGLTYREAEGGHLSPSELLGLTIDSLAAFRSDGALPDAVTPRLILGPPDRWEQNGVNSLTGEKIVDLAADLAVATRSRGMLPRAVNVGSGTYLSPGDFFLAAADVLRDLASGKDVPAEVKIRRSELALEEHVSGDDAWGWSIFSEGFAGERLIEMGKLQTWTLKPAVLAAT